MPWPRAADSGKRLCSALERRLQRHALQPLPSTLDAAISSWAASPDRGFRRADDPACAH